MPQGRAAGQARAVETTPEPRSPLRRTAVATGRVLGWSGLAVAGLWAFGALWFDFPLPEFRHAAAVVFAAGLLAAPLILRSSAKAALVWGLAILLVLVWWWTLEPRQYRDWKPEVALTPWATVEGDSVTIRNLRNFHHRSPGDSDARYETRRVSLSGLRAVDMFINYWGSPHMAHPILSFDFGPQGRVCFSIETRQEKGESYSALGGLYRRFELFYVVADERDVVRLRTNCRQGEDVYLYRLDATRARETFLEYIKSINELREKPRWYHALTNNCTTAIRHQRAASDRAPWDWRLLVNGHGDELLYERGGIDTSLPFRELKRISHINERAKAADQDPLFSERIREGLPGMSR